MKTKEVQQSLEEFVTNEWSGTQIAFDNSNLNSDIYDEFIQLTIQFGPALHVGMVGCYRVIGLVIVTVYVRPDIGTNRLQELADQAAMMLVAKQVTSVSPLSAPVVQLKAPEFARDLRAQNGWVKTQVSCPFLYHVEI